MNKKVLFILMTNYRDEEFIEPYSIITETGFHVDVAGLQPGLATGSQGYTFEPKLQLADLTDEQLDAYDALVIPGGPGSTTYLWGNERIMTIVKRFHDQKKIVAAICHACAVLAQTGILTNKAAAIYPSDEAKAIFAEHNVSLSDEGCVTIENEKIVTAQGPAFAQEFGYEIIDLLKE